jgi:hypothetical protein
MNTLIRKTMQSNQDHLSMCTQLVNEHLRTPQQQSYIETDINQSNDTEFGNGSANQADIQWKCWKYAETMFGNNPAQ